MQKTTGTLKRKVNLVPQKLLIYEKLKIVQWIVLGICVAALIIMAIFAAQGYMDIDQLEKEVAEAGAKYAGFYVCHRRKRDVSGFQKMIDGWIAGLREIGKNAPSSWIKVLFALPDGYGAERVRIIVDGQQIASGVFKHGDDPFYEIYFFLPDGITAPEEVRVQRLLQRENITEEYARARIRAQKGEAYFARHCDHILWNDCPTKEAFEARCDALLDTILKG